MQSKKYNKRMRDVIKNRITLIVEIVGFIGGLSWALTTGFDYEPVILTLVSLIGIIAHFIVPDLDSDIVKENTNNNRQSVSLNVNIGNNPPIQQEPVIVDQPSLDRSTIIDSMLSKTSILFIDDDKNFNIVKILKDSGWKKVKTVTDIRTLNVPFVKESDIIFVDINGVGKLLELEYEGLDLALMLKQKYPIKKIVIYSANRNSNSFHEAWDICDYKLEKNALPFQFQNLVEEYSIEIYKSRK